MINYMDPTSIAAVSVATSKFANEVTDPKAAILSTFSYYQGNVRSCAVPMYTERYIHFAGFLPFSLWLESNCSMTLHNPRLEFSTISWASRLFRLMYRRRASSRLFSRPRRMLLTGWGMQFLLDWVQLLRHLLIMIHSLLNRSYFEGLPVAKYTPQFLNLVKDLTVVSTICLRYTPKSWFTFFDLGRGQRARIQIPSLHDPRRRTLPTQHPVP